jgi:DNA-binding Lrp family transcriptional regulator
MGFLGDCMRTLDSTDLRILRVLQQDGNLTVAQVAERAGLTQSPCSRRIQAMSESGVITGRTVELNRDKLGFGLLVESRIKLHAHDAKLLETFKASVQAIPEVQSAMLMLGEFDFRLQVVVRDIKHYQVLLQEKLTSLPGIKEIQSAVVLETVKSTHALPL